MRESKFYQEILEEGILKGIRQSITQILERRLGPDAVAEFREALENFVDEQQLSDLLDVASQCRRVTEFRRSIRSLAGY